VKELAMFSKFIVGALLLAVTFTDRSSDVCKSNTADPTRQSITAVSGSTANKLLGEITTVHIFVSTLGNEWSRTDKDKVKKVINAGHTFLTRRGSEQGKVVKFHASYVGDMTDVVVEKLPRSFEYGNDPDFRSDGLAKHLGFSNQGELLKFTRDNSPSREVVFFVWVNGKGRSYAMFPFGEDLRRSIVFYNSPALEFTYAHELLHMFGAPDLYEEQAGAFLATNIDIFYPNDIMHASSYDINKLDIGLITASYIGWTDGGPLTIKGLDACDSCCNRIREVEKKSEYLVLKGDRATGQKRKK
jgi:hypothetical protein